MDEDHIMNDAGRAYIVDLVHKFLNHPDIVLMTAIDVHEIWKIDGREVPLMFTYADSKTDRDTFQAMEALVHNLCTMNSRAGAQTVFSSINTGLDTSVEGRMVTKNLFLMIEKGTGNGETAIFPITIMQLKKGITDKGSPNYDLFQLSCKVSAKRLFPNWVNCDAPFNLPFYKADDPRTFAATMGCRTRVIGNYYDENNQIFPGRGNLFPITMNLPYVALEAKEEAGEGASQEELLKIFFRRLTQRQMEIFDVLDDRFELIAKRKAKNFPFLMGQHLYIGSEKLNPNDEIREVIKHGTLTTGFIGLSETLVVLTGKHHGESPESQKLGLEIIGHLNQMNIDRSKEKHLNYTLMGSPAEGCAGRLLQCTRKRFGVIEGVTNHEYLTNSSHK